MKTQTEGRRPARFVERPTVGLTLGVALALLLVNVSPAGAHPEATLESDRSTVAAGGSIALHGSEFGGVGTYALSLQGVLNEYALGEATSDGEGRFQLTITVPVDVRPGSYQVVALASDGDVAARLDLLVSAAAAMPMDADEHADMGGAAMPAQAATAEEIQIERDRSGIEWAAIGLVIGVAGGLGIGMRRRQPTG